VVSPVRTRPLEPRSFPPAAATLVAVVFPAVMWGILARSAWVGVTTFVLSGLPPAWFHAKRPPFLPWLGFGLLAGGTMAATAFLARHTPVP
jgi:hypothetical protein